MSVKKIKALIKGMEADGREIQGTAKELILALAEMIEEGAGKTAKATKAADTDTAEKSAS